MFYTNRFKAVDMALPDGKKVGMYLVNTEKPEGVDMIPARNLAKKLAYFDFDLEKLFFYVFYEGRIAKYIFVSYGEINLDAFECRLGEKKQNFRLDGVIYDIDKKDFVCPPSVKNVRNSLFYKFLLYDAGLPNIIVDDEKEEYTILYLNSQKEFVYEKTTCLPTVVTYLNDDGNTRKRAIFYKKNYLKDYMGDIWLTNELVVLENDINYKLIYQGAEFEAIIFNKQDEVQATKSKNAETTIWLTSYVIRNDSCVIVRSPYGTYGELLILFLNDGISINDENSFYSFEAVEPICANLKDHSIIKVAYELDDFTNREAYFDVTSRMAYQEQP